VTDIGVGYLSTMTSLCRLYLRWCTLLRDFGLQHLYTMKNLTALSLAGNAPLYSAYTNPSPYPSMHDFPVCLFNPAFRGCQNPINGLLLLSSLFHRATLCQRGICYRRVSVCPSVRHKPVLYRNYWINRACFGTGASFHLSHTVLLGNVFISKNYGTSFWDFVPNSGIRKFHRGKSIALSTTLVIVVVVVDGRAC